jgi:cytochrome c5
MKRITLPILCLALSACAGGPGLQTQWPAHPEDAAWIEASLDRRMAESLGALALLSAQIDAAGPGGRPLAAAQDAALAAASVRALANARAAIAGSGAEARRALLFATAAAACHEGVARIAPRIGAGDDGPSPAEALRLAQFACISSQTLRSIATRG